MRTTSTARQRRFPDHTPPWHSRAFMGTREPQTILKTDERQARNDSSGLIVLGSVRKHLEAKLRLKCKLSPLSSYPMPL